MSTIRIKIYRAQSGKLAKLVARRPQPWRWRATAGNGKVLAVSSEAYTNYDDCEAAVKLLFGPETDMELDDARGLGPIILRTGRLAGYGD